MPVIIRMAGPNRIGGMRSLASRISDAGTALLRSLAARRPARHLRSRTTGSHSSVASAVSSVPTRLPKAPTPPANASIWESRPPVVAPAAPRAGQPSAQRTRAQRDDHIVDGGLVVVLDVFDGVKRQAGQRHLRCGVILPLNGILGDLGSAVSRTLGPAVGFAIRRRTRPNVPTPGTGPQRGEVVEVGQRVPRGCRGAPLTPRQVRDSPREHGELAGSPRGKPASVSDHALGRHIEEDEYPPPDMPSTAA